MRISRREFLFLTGALVGGCQTEKPIGPRQSQTIDAGPADRFAADGVYANFRDQGFFIVRQRGKLFALSSYCTHRRCKLTAEADHTFSCPCHGSAFDPVGKVTEGPAVRDLPVLTTATDSGGHLRVSVPS